MTSWLNLDIIIQINLLKMNVFKYLHRVETKNLLENLKKEVLDLNSTLNLKLPTMLMLVNS